MTGWKGKTPKEPQPVATDQELAALWESCFADRRKLTGKLSRVRASIRAGRKQPDDFVRQAEDFLNPLAERIGDLKWEIDEDYRSRINLLSQNQKVRSAEQDRLDAEDEAFEEAERQRKAAQAALDADHDVRWTRINTRRKDGTPDLGFFRGDPPQSIELLRYAHYMIGEHIKDNKPINDPIGLLDEMFDYLSMHYEPEKTAPVPAEDQG